GRGPRGRSAAAGRHLERARVAARPAGRRSGAGGARAGGRGARRRPGRGARRGGPRARDPGRARRRGAARPRPAALRAGLRAARAPRDRGRRSPAHRSGAPRGGARSEPPLAHSSSSWLASSIAEDRSMLDAPRLKEEFIELVSISSPSRREGTIARRLEAILKGVGATVEVDAAGEKIEGNTGNLLARHMDTVGPAEKIRPVIEGDVVRTDGTSVLGGDDKAGVVAILEAIRVL